MNDAQIALQALREGKTRIEYRHQPSTGRVIAKLTVGGHGVYASAGNEEDARSALMEALYTIYKGAL
jgi:hypothetical protein